MVGDGPGLASFDGARDILAEVVGARLARVRYLLLFGSDALDRSTARIHLIDKTIELIFDKVSISARWVMDADAGGLELQRGQLADVDPDYGDLVDMSGGPQWSRRVGDRVTRVGIALHRPADIYGEETFGDWVWAVRLEFDGAQPSVIALGDLPACGGVLDPEPRFSPDNLLVLFGKEEAKAYWIETSIDSSWGDTI